MKVCSSPVKNLNLKPEIIERKEEKRKVTRWVASHEH
jgi:hypothetical protein